MIWNNNRLGAAYYNIVTSELFVLEDTIDDFERFDVQTMFTTLFGSERCGAIFFHERDQTNFNGANNERRIEFVRKRA